MRHAIAEGHRADDPAGDATLQGPKSRNPPNHYRAIHYSLRCVDLTMLSGRIVFRRHET